MTALRAAALAAVLMLSACAPRVAVPPPATPIPVPAPSPPPPATARDAGVTLVAPQLVPQAAAIRALAAFRKSCGSLTTRTDASGLAVPADWVPLCAEAATLGDTPAAAQAFFMTRFAWAQVGDGAAFVTGYYEPEIAGTRSRQPGFEVPVYAKPADLIRDTSVGGTGKRVRMDHEGQMVPYYSRAEIEDGALDGRGLEIGYAAKAVDLFFLQVQGSGRLRAPDGSVMRIGYADQNGLAYVAIGKLLRDRGVFQPGQATMQAIVAWIEAHPEEGRALMRENPSYVFFRELTGEGPLGALGVAVTPGASLAADPKFVPLGAPVFLDGERDELDGLWVAQDTGGAIKGANRFDSFWGAGDAAAATAGGMAAKGRALILLPLAAATRVRTQP